MSPKKLDNEKTYTDIDMSNVMNWGCWARNWAKANEMNHVRDRIYLT